MVEIADGEHETGVIHQYDVGVRRFSEATESEVLFEKVAGCRYISDRKVDVIGVSQLSPSFLDILSLRVGMYGSW
jgi:hypothetical protein